MARELRSLDDLRVLPLWETELMVEVRHLHTDSRFVEIIAGVLGNMSWNANGFQVCIGGKGVNGEGRWVNVQSSTHREVTVFEV